MKLSKRQIKESLKAFKSKSGVYLPGSPKDILMKNFRGEL